MLSKLSASWCWKVRRKSESFDVILRRRLCFGKINPFKRYLFEFSIKIKSSKTENKKKRKNLKLEAILK